MVGKKSIRKGFFPKHERHPAIKEKPYPVGIAGFDRLAQDAQHLLPHFRDGITHEHCLAPFPIDSAPFRMCPVKFAVKGFLIGNGGGKSLRS